MISQFDNKFFIVYHKNMCKFRRFFAISIVILAYSFSILSASYKHEKGDFQLGLRIPFAIPAFSTTQDDGGKVYTFWDTGYKNILVGLEADVGIFLSDNISIGGLLGYNFAYDRGDNLFSKVPLLFRFNYFVSSHEKYEIPISLGLGINYFKYRSMEHIVPQAMFETGFNYYWSDNWSVLFRTGFNFYTELYKDTSKISMSGTIPIVLGVTYRK